MIVNNGFRTSYRGVYIESQARPNLGDRGNTSTTDNGNNTFLANSDYDIYNASVYDIKAEGNTFVSTSADVIDRVCIYDKLDSASYGRVDYAPLKSGAPTAPAPAAMSLAAAPTGNGGAQITVNLTAAGDLETQILNMAGRPVRAWPSTAAAAGANTLLWDGKSSSGLAVPGGAYLVTVTCRSAGGTQQRQVARVNIAR